MDNWASNMLDTIWRGQQPANGKNVSEERLLGIVTSTVPLTISIAGVPVCKNLYINPAILLESDQPDKIRLFFSEARKLFSKCPEMAPGPVELLTFLEQYHEASVIRVGDMVSVVKAGAEFYIQEKVVKVS